MALYSGKAFCRRRQCCRSAGTCHSKACSMSELSGAVHDGSCSRFAAASVTYIPIRGWNRFPGGETDLQSVSISGLSVEIHTTGTASRVCCNANDKSSYVKLRQAMDYKTWDMHIPFAVRVRMWGGLFLIGERCKVQSWSPQVARWISNFVRRTENGVLVGNLSQMSQLKISSKEHWNFSRN